jgi:hypothetical protein
VPRPEQGRGTFARIYSQPETCFFLPLALPVLMSLASMSQIKYDALYKKFFTHPAIISRQTE